VKRLLHRALGRETAYAALMPVLRMLGRALPPAVLWIALWPVMLGVAVCEWGLLKQFFADTGPASRLLGNRRPRFTGFVVHSTRLNLSRLAYLWPETLHSNRFRVEEAGGFTLSGLADQPTVLVMLHSGPMTILLEWLRAQGHPVAIVSLRPLSEMAKYRLKLTAIRDRAAGLQDITPVIASGQTWEMHDHLLKHKLLLVAIEAEQPGRHVQCVESDGVSIAMVTGALQLAGMTGARVLPCSIRSERFFGATLRFGPYLNAADLTSKPGIAAAASDLWKLLKPMAEMAPCEWEYTLLQAIRQADAAKATKAEKATTPPRVSPLTATVHT
jgi:lauroyl/myristoyl acyltransferase